MQKSTQYYILTLVYMIASIICSIIAINLETQFCHTILLIAAWIFVGIQLFYLYKQIRHIKENDKRLSKQQR